PGGPRARTGVLRLGNRTVSLRAELPQIAGSVARYPVLRLLREGRRRALARDPQLELGALVGCGPPLPFGRSGVIPELWRRRGSLLLRMRTSRMADCFSDGLARRSMTGMCRLRILRPSS